MRVVSLAAVLAIVAAPMAIAQTKPKKPIDPNKKICRQDSSTGSILPKSTCHTYAEWQAIDAANEKATESFRNRPTPSGGGN